MNTITSTRRSPLRFFLLVFAISLPFWLAGALTTLQLLPGIPLTALIIVFCPATAAVILVYRESKTAGVRALLKRSVDFKKIKEKIWYLPIVLLVPGNPSVWGDPLDTGITPNSANPGLNDVGHFPCDVHCGRG